MISFYQYVYDSKAGTSYPGHFEKLRVSSFKLLKLMGGSEVLYLADKGRMNSYLDMVMEGNTYASVYAALEKKFGPPITDLSQILYTKINELADKDFLDKVLNMPESSIKSSINEFVVDRFDDVK